MGSTPVTTPDSVSVLSLVRPPLVMLVVKPVSVKIVLPSDSDKTLPGSLPIFGIWLALVMATAVVDVAAFSIVPFKANEEAIGGTTLLSVVLNTSSVPPTTSPPAANSSPAVARFRGLRSRKGFGSDVGEPVAGVSPTHPRTMPHPALSAAHSRGSRLGSVELPPPSPHRGADALGRSCDWRAASVRQHFNEGRAARTPRGLTCP